MRTGTNLQAADDIGPEDKEATESVLQMSIQRAIADHGSAARDAVTSR